MRKTLLTTIAGAALIAGGGLAAAQTRESSPGDALGVQGSSQREPGGAVHERQPAMQGRSTATGEEGRRSGQSGTMQGQTQKRSGAMQNKGHRSSQSGAMQSQAQERSGAPKGKAHRSNQSDATQGQAQERSGAMKGKEHRSTQSGMQSPAEERSGAMKGKEHRSTQSGMQGLAQGRSGAVMDKEHRSGQSGTAQGSPQQRSSVGSSALSSDQRTRLQQTVASGNIHRVDHVNFALSVGTQLPNSVTFYDVPERIADIVPQYRGFKYIAVRDDFAIIDPSTRDIVAVIPMHGSAVGRTGRSVGSTTLSSHQKTRLHTVITGGNIRRVGDVDFPLTVGTRVPDTVTFYDLPETIVDIVPEYRGDEYIVVGDQLVIIDPETLEILAVLPA